MRERLSQAARVPAEVCREKQTVSDGEESRQKGQKAIWGVARGGARNAVIWRGRGTKKQSATRGKMCGLHLHE